MMDLSDYRTATTDRTGPQTLEALAHEALGACHADLLAARHTVLHARHPEGIHGTRVALRRLRAGATLFGRPLADERLLGLRADAKQLADACGPTRDLDVFLAGVLREAEDALSGGTGFGAELRRLRATAMRLRRHRHNAVRGVLAGEIFTVFDARLGGLLAGPSSRPDAPQVQPTVFAPDATGFARDVLGRRDRKLRKLLKQIETLDGEARHQVRLRVKKQRYAATFLAKLFDRKSAAAYIHAAAALQDALGLANDRVVAAHVVADIREAVRPKGRLDWISGAVAAWLEMHAAVTNDDRVLASAVKHFRRAERFWRDGRSGER